VFKIDQTPPFDACASQVAALTGGRSVKYTVIGFNGPSARRIEMLVDDDNLVEVAALADKLAASGYEKITVTAASRQNLFPERTRHTELKRGAMHPLMISGQGSAAVYWQLAGEARQLAEAAQSADVRQQLLQRARYLRRRARRADLQSGVNRTTRFRPAPPLGGQC
jgi:hypothetical protein